jgi:hypothetical protein
MEKKPGAEAPPVSFLIDVIPSEQLKEEGYSIHVKLAEWTGERGGERGMSIRILGTEFKFNSFNVGSKRYGVVSNEKIRREVI